MANKIFINYRKDDSPWNSLAVYQELITHFSKENIFKDFNTIAPGADFVESIENALEVCDVLLVLMSEKWLTLEDKRGNRRIHNEDDFVRLEIATALRRNICVIPVLFDNASLPQADELPEDLKKLSRRQFVEIDKTRFESDMEKLIVAIKNILLADNKKQAVKEEPVYPAVKPEPEPQPEPIPVNIAPVQPVISKSSSETRVPSASTPVLTKTTNPVMILLFGGLSAILCCLLETMFREEIEVIHQLSLIVFGLFMLFPLKNYNRSTRLRPILLIFFFIVLSIINIGYTYRMGLPGYISICFYGFIAVFTLASFKIIFKIRFLFWEYATTFLFSALLISFSLYLVTRQFGYDYYMRYAFYPLESIFLNTFLYQVFLSALIFFRVRKELSSANP